MPQNLNVGTRHFSRQQGWLRSKTFLISIQKHLLPGLGIQHTDLFFGAMPLLAVSAAFKSSGKSTMLGGIFYHQHVNQFSRLLSRTILAHEGGEEFPLLGVIYFT